MTVLEETFLFVVLLGKAVFLLLVFERTGKSICIDCDEYTSFVNNFDGEWTVTACDNGAPIKAVIPTIQMAIIVCTLCRFRRFFITKVIK